MKKLYTFLYLSICFFLLGCQQETFSTDSNCLNNIAEESVSKIGYYHNEIIKNFVTLSNIPSNATTKASVDSNDFLQTMANYGAAVRLAYKNDPPSSDMNQWVGDILRTSLTSNQVTIVERIIGGMTITDAINTTYRKNVVSNVVKSYLAELNILIQQYGGTIAYSNQLTLLGNKYARLASGEDGEIISWATGVAEGSHEYWNSEYKQWNAQLSGRFWDNVLNYGGRLLSADISGAIEYYLGYKLGIITGALTWKIAAAYAALNSTLCGVELILSSATRSSNDGYSIENIKNITYEDVYRAYLHRVEELEIH